MNAADALHRLNIDPSRLYRLSNDLDRFDFNPRRLNGRKPGGRDWDYAPEEVERFAALERPRGRRSAVQARMSDLRARSRELAAGGGLRDRVAPECTRADALQALDDAAAGCYLRLLGDALARFPRLAQFRAALLEDIERAREASRTEDIRSSEWHLREMETLQIVLGDFDRALVEERGEGC